MSFVNQNQVNKIREKQILEKAMLMHFSMNLSVKKKQFSLMWEYVKNHNEVIRKFKLKLPQGNDNEIINFIKILVQPRFHNEGKDLWLGKKDNVNI